MWTDKLDEFCAYLFMPNHLSFHPVFLVTKKETGELEAFDPTSSMVHPSSRPKRPSIKVMPLENRRQLRARPPTLRKVISEDESGDDSAEDAAFKPKSRARVVSDEEELDYVISDDDIPLRRSKREAAARGNANLKQSTLNFSRDGSSRQLRKSTRRIQSSSEEEEEEEEEEDEVVPLTKPAKSQRPKAHKPIAPGYGVIHFSGYDYDVDAPLSPGQNRNYFVHREFCEACSELPAHEQLQDLKLSKGKRNTKETTRIMELGGWVLW
jgi:chromodomain-helicase-DNA-binding protein 4